MISVIARHLMGRLARSASILALCSWGLGKNRKYYNIIFNIVDIVFFAELLRIPLFTMEGILGGLCTPFATYKLS